MPTSESGFFEWVFFFIRTQGALFLRGAGITLLISLMFAYFLNGKVFFQKVMRTFVFIPYISNMVALALLFRCLFRSDGIINSMLTQTFGMKEGLKWIYRI